MTNEAPIVEARGLGRKAETWLVREIDFAIRAGNRKGIVGASGSGKTVLLRALAALDPVESGQLLFEGNAVPGAGIPGYRARVAYLSQRPVLFEGTVEFNLQKPFELGIHKGRQYDTSRLSGWLGLLGRDQSFLQKQQQTLSGGETQIVALLRAMQLDPLVLLLDEPTAALDSAATTAVEQLINRWMEEATRRAFVWITHSVGQARRMCDTVHRMEAGKLTDG